MENEYFDALNEVAETTAQPVVETIVTPPEAEAPKDWTYGVSISPPPAPVLRPEKTPEIMTALRLRHKTHFGHLHVSIAVDVKTDREYEVFAQLGKAGELTASELEGMCRLASLYLRAGGALKDVTKQLLGIGSAHSSSHKEKVSIANGLGEALARYTEFKKKYGLTALLLGEIEISEE